MSLMETVDKNLLFTLALASMTFGLFITIYGYHNVNLGALGIGLLIFIVSFGVLEMLARKNTEDGDNGV